MHLMAADDHYLPEAILFLAIILENDVSESHCKETPIFQFNLDLLLTCKSDYHIITLVKRDFFNCISHIKYQERGTFFAFLLSL